MKIEKNKIVFGSVLLFIILFIVSYTLMVMEQNEENQEFLEQVRVPELSEENKTYTRKIDAVNAIKEVKKSNAPSMYAEKPADSLGTNPNLSEEAQKKRIVDSILKSGRIQYTHPTTRMYTGTASQPKAATTPKQKASPKDTLVAIQELGLEHQLFFASAPAGNTAPNLSTQSIRVKVDGQQTVKTNYRLQMRITEEVLIDNKVIPKNTPVFGFVRMQSNRVLIVIESIAQQPIQLKAFDVQDGSEGIYIENSFRAEASQEVMNDVVQGINIAGVPQVNGIKNVFRRTNRNVKVTILDNYQLLLKPAL